MEQNAYAILNVQNVHAMPTNHSNDNDRLAKKKAKRKRRKSFDVLANKVNWTNEYGDFDNLVSLNVTKNEDDSEEDGMPRFKKFP